MRVLLAGGGTAGHVEPAMSLAEALERRRPVAITALGTATGLEATLVPARGYDLRLIPRVPLPRRPSLDLVSLPVRLRGAVRAARAVIDSVQPHVVVGFGGYVALPAYLAARRAGVPIVVHEANARAGMANRIGARFTQFVAVSTPDSTLAHGQLTGIPLRRAVATLNRANERKAARLEWGLDPERSTLLVFGGSQGAARINNAMSAAATQLLARGIQVLHVVGPGNEVDVPSTAGLPPYVVVPYIDHMDRAYAAADLVLCRSGAMTCAELAAVGLPGVFVPYPHSNGEQELNAAPMVAAGAGLLIADAELTGTQIIESVAPLLEDRERLSLMSERASTLGYPDADERLVDMVLEAAGRRP
ncbi:MAG TPA: undecaprenyldiphospho-muramoylpentapeptide beta-N-acetylglucosaminyltransferase [Actinomycetes bacterium]|nr:undecaprenyldiphospho-muramoylpentapeptide beta-N-acetylglucosaminyltransferase [Actinomycetes bacterium]